MSLNPKVIPAEVFAPRAVALTEQHSIASLFVLEDLGRQPKGGGAAPRPPESRHGYPLILAQPLLHIP